MAEYIDKANVYKLFEDTSGIIRLHVADVDQIPAADVAPVVHGRWEKYNQSACVYMCSECGLKGVDYDVLLMNYCPKCGAKMIME